MIRGMKKLSISLLCIIFALSIAGCTKNNAVKRTVRGNMNTYSEMRDGTWMCKNYVCKYRLEISGRMPNAAKDSTFVYLSNIEDISFEQAYMAAGISSNTEDYFPPDDAVLVEME